MKTFLMLFVILTSFSYASSYNVEDLKPLSQSANFEYEMDKKQPWGAVAGAFLLPSAGHAYAGNWGRGLGFLAGEILALGIMANASKDNVYYYSYNSSNGYSSYETGTENDWMIGLGALAFISLRIWEHVDAFKTAQNYNYNLYRKLSFTPLVSTEEKSVGLKVAYTF